MAEQEEEKLKTTKSPANPGQKSSGESSGSGEKIKPKKPAAEKTGQKNPPGERSGKQASGESKTKAGSGKEKEETTAEGSPEKEEKESYLKDLMAISGYGGLFRFVSQGRNGVIVESIETGKRMQAFATMKISSLEDIAVYTEKEEVQLEDVLAAIHKYENGKEAISPKSDPDELKDYLGAVLPEYDRERVYASDIKKILTWYNLLLKYDLIKIDKPEKKPEAKKEKG